jgi:hypothetical protein
MVWGAAMLALITASVPPLFGKTAVFVQFPFTFQFCAEAVTRFVQYAATGTEGVALACVEFGPSPLGPKAETT